MATAMAGNWVIQAAGRRLGLPANVQCLLLSKPKDLPYTEKKYENYFGIIIKFTEDSLQYL